MLRVDCSMAHFLVFCREFGISVRKTDDCNRLWRSVIIELSISDSKSPVHRKEWIYMFENFKFRIFVKYFLILSGFLLIPFFTLSMLLTHYVMAEYKNEIYDLAYNSVVYIRDMVDEELDARNQIEALVREDSDIRNFLNTSAGTVRGDKIYKAYKVAEAMEDYTAYRDILAGVHLYSELQDVVLASKVIYTREEYFERFLQDCGMTCEEWCQAMEADAPVLNSMLINDSTRGITIAMVDMLQRGNGKDSALIAVMDLPRIREIYEQMTEEMPQMYFAVSCDDRVLTESGELPENVEAEQIYGSGNREVLKGDHIVFRSSSNKVGLEYICVMSEKVILEKFTRIQLLLYVVILVLAMGLVVLAFLFSNVTFGPVREMIRAYHSDNTYQMKGLTDLQDLFINVFNSNMKLRELLSSQEKCIHNNMFRLLIQNSMELDHHALQVIFRSMPISLQAPYFRVAIIRIKEQKERTEESLNFRIMTQLHYKTEEAGIEYCVIPNEVNKNILLFAYEQQGCDVGAVLKQIQESLKKKEKVETIISVGREITTLNDFSKSYEDAILAPENSTGGFSRGGYSTLAEKMDFIDREKLVSYILAGNVDKLNMFFDTLYAISFEGYLLTHRVQNYIRYALCEILTEALEGRKNHNLKLSKLLEQCKSALEYGEYENSYRIMRDCFQEAAAEISEQQNGRKKGLEDVICYIDENYALYDISLKTVSEEMELSYKYLSEVFKKETGRTFLEYLHELRSRKAKELLTSTEIPIAEIGEQIGYLSSNTFIKTFKKLNGVTPGEYRSGMKS